MYCDKPLRLFVTVYIVRLVLTAPIVIYTHLIPRRRSTTLISPRTSARSELTEAYALSERNRPLSVPAPVLPTNHRQHYPAFVAPVELVNPISHDTQPFDENSLRIWVDRYIYNYLYLFFLLYLIHL